MQLQPLTESAAGLRMQTRCCHQELHRMRMSLSVSWPDADTLPKSDQTVAAKAGNQTPTLMEFQSQTKAWLHCERKCQRLTVEWGD